MNNTVHHWDFFGPEASKTAEHFKKHMAEFLQKHEFTSAAEGFFSAQKNHTCYWTEISDTVAAQETKKKLRPQRSLSPNEHDHILAEIAASN